VTPLEIFVDGKTIMFKKYQPSTEELAEECAKFVSKVRNNIASIGCYGDSTTVVLKSGRAETVVKHYSDTYDINVAVCYALAKMNVANYDNPVVNNI
jgi:predicted dinucleotide-utilizing enzyme